MIHIYLFVCAIQKEFEMNISRSSTLYDVLTLFFCQYDDLSKYYVFNENSIILEKNSLQECSKNIPCVLAGISDDITLLLL